MHHNTDQYLINLFSRILNTDNVIIKRYYICIVHLPYKGMLKKTFKVDRRVILILLVYMEDIELFV